MMRLTLLFTLLCLLTFTQCNNGKEDENGCGSIVPDIELVSPYEEPVWHPSGSFIGFNYTPLTRITYTRGFNCPKLAEYEQNFDSTGFYLINADGTNQRRVLPFKIFTPSWSPDGSWIAFHLAGTIYKMPFNGEEFDVNQMVSITEEGSNFFPSWSPDGELLTYDNTNCGSAGTNPPPNSCGILVMSNDGSGKGYLAPGRFPSWSPEGIVYGGNCNEQGAIVRFNPIDSTNTCVAIIPPEWDLILGQIKNSWDDAYIGIILQVLENPSFSGVTLYTVSSVGGELAPVTATSIHSYDWGPNNEIVYQYFDYNRLDEEKGTLWIMNQDGTGKRQLTFHNNLEIIIP